MSSSQSNGHAGCSNTSGRAPTQNEQAQKKLFDNPEFARMYKVGERLTGEFAKNLLKQLHVEASTELVNWLDLACGTGVVGKYAIEALSQARGGGRLLPEDRFTFFDLAPAMLAVLEKRIGEEKWQIETPQTKIERGDMRDTKLPSDTYSHLSCNFGPTLVPGPERVLRESYRVLRPGGTAGWTAWQRVGWLPDMERATNEIREAAAQRCIDGKGTEDDQKLSKIPKLMLPEEFIARLAGIDFDKMRKEGVKEADLPRWDKEVFVRSEVEKAGFSNVKTETITKEFELDQADAYAMLKPLIGILGTFWTEEERQAMEGIDMSTKYREWWERRFDEDDVKDGRIVWKDFTATVVTGSKAG